MTRKPPFELLVAVYDAAWKAEDLFRNTVWRPECEASEATGREIDRAIDLQMERCGEVTAAAEDALVALPAETAEHALIKVIIALDDGRCCDVYFAAILADAKRLTGRIGEGPLRQPSGAV